MPKRRARGKAKRIDSKASKVVEDEKEEDKEIVHAAHRTEDEELKDLEAAIKGQSGKDAMIKALIALESKLEVAPQARMSVRSAYLPCALALMQSGAIRQKDKEAKLLLATCLAHVMRLYAGVPDHPYNDARLEDVFKLFMWTFRLLDDAGGSSYPRALHVLEIVSQIKCCVLLLDFEKQDLTVEMLGILLNVVNAENQASVLPLSLDVICDIVRACEGDISQEMLDIVLGSMLEHGRENPPAYALVSGVLQRCELELVGPIQSFLCAAIETGPLHGSELHDRYHEIIFMLYKTLPSMLGNVLPSLEMELSVDDEEKRASAVMLMGNVFAVGEGEAVSDYPGLFQSYLDRYHDKKMGIRLQVVEQSRNISNVSGEARESVMSALEERLLDPEEKVRSSAVSALCDIGSIFPSDIDKQTLLHAAARLRDKRVSVRKEAMHKLAKIFCHLSSMEEVLFEKVVWIPSKILPLVFDEHIGLLAVEKVIQNELLPSQVEAEAVVEIWSKALIHFEPTAMQALHDVLSSKATLQEKLRTYLKNRSARKGATGEEVDSIDANIMAALQGIARHFPEKEKALEHLMGIHALKDGHVFRDFETLVDCEAVPEALHRAETDVLKRIGARSTLYDFTRTFCMRITFSPFHKKHVAILLDTAGDILENSAAPLADPYTTLLLCLSRALPMLFGSFLPRFERILQASEKCHDTMVESMLKIIVSAGKSFASPSEEFTKLRTTLSRICRTGTRQQAKYAVRALHALFGSQVLDLVTTLGTAMQNALKASNSSLGRKKAALVAFANLVQLYPEEISPKFPSVLDTVLDILLSKETSADIVSLKIEGIKFLARVCLPPDTGSLRMTLPEAMSVRAAEALSSLTAMVEVNQDGVPTEESPEVRLAAAKALLRIVRWRHLRIHAEAYRSVAYIALDPVAEVRQGFATKLYKGVRCFGLSSKFAAIFAFFALDVETEIVDYAKSCLRSFILSRRQSAQRSVSAGAKLATSSLPEFLLPFLLHMMAHHPDFPNLETIEDGTNDNEIAESLSPFQKILTFAIGALLLPSDGQEAGSGLPAILAILRKLKVVQDPHSSKASCGIWTLADIGLKIVKEIALKKHWDITRTFPGSIPVPNMFTPREQRRDMYASPSGRRPSVEGSYLPKQLMSLSPSWKDFNSTSPIKRSVPMRGADKTPTAGAREEEQSGTPKNASATRRQPSRQASASARAKILRDAEQSSDAQEDTIGARSELQLGSPLAAKQTKRYTPPAAGKENEITFPRRTRRRVY